MMAVNGTMKGQFSLKLTKREEKRERERRGVRKFLCLSSAGQQLCHPLPKAPTEAEDH